MMEKYSEKDIKLVVQEGHGKGDAVRSGFSFAKGDILMILDGDLTVPPEDLPKFYRALADDVGEFINGCRLVYPMEKQAMKKQVIEKQIINQVDEVVAALDNGKKAEDFKKLATERKYYVFIMEKSGHLWFIPICR
jgi:glycosyltransferase involved in cell wall biosynthesis